MKLKFSLVLILPLMLLSVGSLQKEGIPEKDLDARVLTFLKSHKHDWHDENIPEKDGKVLFDIIIKNKYTHALEIGTSTGRSAIWIAWALSKTGGKLITVEINKNRYEKALAHFEEAGLSRYIDARLANAHELVVQLEGPFDFVFLDADKVWYKRYFKLLYPKLKRGGCFTAHNAVNLGYLYSVKSFLEYVQNHPSMETTIDRTSWTGISISYKKNP